MKNKVLAFIGFTIITCGLLFYMSALTSDYAEGVKKTEDIGSPENTQVKLSAATQLAIEGKKQEAIDLLLESLEETPKELSLQLKLAQLYSIQCKEDKVHCEEALWQLNVILEIDSTNKSANLMLDEIKKITDPNQN